METTLVFGQKNSSTKFEFTFKLKRTLIEELPKFLSLIKRNPLEKSVLYLNMNKSYCKEFLKQLQNHPLYKNFDWNSQISQNNLEFGMDNISLKLNINEYIPNKKIVIVTERYFTQINYILSNDYFIFYEQVDLDYLKDLVNYIISQPVNEAKINFLQITGYDEYGIIKNQNGITIKNPFKVIFNKDGVTDESVEICCQIAKNKIYKSIEDYANRETNKTRVEQTLTKRKNC